MELESITCGACGAPLQTPDNARFVTCNFCHANLVIHRETSVTYSEKIADIDERTRRMADDLKELRSESDLAKLERELERKRQNSGAFDEVMQGVGTMLSAIFVAGVMAVYFGGRALLLLVTLGSAGVVATATCFKKFARWIADKRQDPQAPLQLARALDDEVAHNGQEHHGDVDPPSSDGPPSDDPVENFLERSEENARPARDEVAAYLDRAEHGSGK